MAPTFTAAQAPARPVPVGGRRYGEPVAARLLHPPAVNLLSGRLPSRDPLENPEELVRRVYAYVAYRLGHGPDAEDVVAETFERAVRYRRTYDRRRGEPIAWLIGIAKHSISDAVARRGAETPPLDEVADDRYEFEERSLDRIALREAVSRLGERDQELLALRYGADLSSRTIAALFRTRPNTVEVALHRAVGRLRAELTQSETPAPAPGDVATERT